MLNDVPATGSHDDIYNRLVVQLPPWFGEMIANTNTIENTVLESYITTAIFNFAQLQYDQMQMRLQTATEDNLDLISKDYLGDELPRRTGENDNSYRNRISATLLQEKATRPGLQNALYLLTGFEPILFEPWNPLDCGGYNVYQMMGYSTAGYYGSRSYPYQGFATVYCDPYQGMGNYSGYNDYYFGYNAVGENAQGWYGGNSLINIIVTDQDIYDLINLTKVFGTIVWVQIIRTVTPGIN